MLIKSLNCKHAMNKEWYTKKELIQLGFKKIGTNVKISRSCKFYSFLGKVGSNTRIDDYSIFKGKINIGKNVHISSFGYFAAVGGKITIGDLTGISNKVSIYAVSDNFLYSGLTNPTVNKKFRDTIKGKVAIGKNVMIGSHCLILPNITIGNSCAIGSMTLVNKSLKNGETLFTRQDKFYGLSKDLKKINKLIYQSKN